jgi:hypothetical protein
MEQIHNIVGFAGSAMIIIAYLLLQLKKLSSDHIVYTLLNLIGASAIIFSLYFDPNFSAFVVEGFWVLISLIGLYRFFFKKPGAQD